MEIVCEQTHEEEEEEEGGGGAESVLGAVPVLGAIGGGREGGIGAREGEREDKSNGGDSPRLTLFRNEDRM